MLGRFGITGAAVAVADGLAGWGGRAWEATTGFNKPSKIIT